jgi:hypothetical protein
MTLLQAFCEEGKSSAFEVLDVGLDNSVSDDILFLVEGSRTAFAL